MQEGCQDHNWGKDHANNTSKSTCASVRVTIDPPPLYFLIVIQINNIWYTFLESPLVYFNNLKKCKKFAKITFLKSPWHRKFKCAKTFTKLLKLKCVFKKNWKCAHFLYRHLCKNLFKISLQKFCNLIPFSLNFSKSSKMLKSIDWK